MDIITMGAAVDAEKDFCLERFMARATSRAPPFPLHISIFASSRY
jgi:hypothetical protein